MRELTIRNLPELPFDVTEALNQFRVNLGFCGDNIKKVMITSSVPNEGKSFISIQLWKMMAEVGIPTLYIDCDLRNSELRSKLGLSTNEQQLLGTIHYLAGKAELDDVIYKTNITNGYMMPAVGAVVNPTMLLEGERFDQMLKEASKVFDYIIIDTPPLGSVADALNIATHCDGTVLVVRSDDTPKKLVSNSVQLLKRTSTPLLGIVLDRVNTSSNGSSYYRRYYRNGYYYYGGYGSNDKKGKKGKKGANL